MIQFPLYLGCFLSFSHVQFRWGKYALIFFNLLASFFYSLPKNISSGHNSQWKFQSYQLYFNSSTVNVINKKKQNGKWTTQNRQTLPSPGQSSWSYQNHTNYKFKLQILASLVFSLFEMEVMNELTNYH